MGCRIKVSRFLTKPLRPNLEVEVCSQRFLSFSHLRHLLLPDYLQAVQQRILRDVQLWGYRHFGQVQLHQNLVQHQLFKAPPQQQYLIVGHFFGGAISISTRINIGCSKSHHNTKVYFTSPLRPSPSSTCFKPTERQRPNTTAFYDYRHCDSQLWWHLDQL